MTSITPQQAAEITATKVMGWLPHSRNSACYCDAERVNKLMTQNHCFISEWRPTRDTNQAEEVLKAWCEKSLSIPHIELADDGWMVTFDQFVQPYRWIGEKHPSLAMAIITAVCSAIKGYQVTIKEEQD